MRKRAHSANFDLASESYFAVKKRKRVPFEFVLDALSSASPWTRPMFGCLAVYVGEKIVLFLRDKAERPEDNGVWLATRAENHESLRREFPQMRSIQLLGKRVTHWQVLPADAPDFEEAALRACELICAGDPRIGRVPKSRGRRLDRKREDEERSFDSVSRHAQIARKGTARDSAQDDENQAGRASRKTSRSVAPIRKKRGAARNGK